MPAVTYEDVISRLPGLDAWLDAAARGAAKFDQVNIERRIPGWVRRFERECQFRINPVQVCTSLDGTYNTPTLGAGTVSSTITKVVGVGTSFLSFYQPDQIITVNADSMPIKSIESNTALTLYDPPPVPWSTAAYGKLLYPIYLSSAYPYDRDAAEEFLMTTLRDRPIRTVQRLRMMLNGKLIAVFPSEWYTWENNGRFWIIPLFASAAITGTAAALSVFGTINDFVPNLLHFDYIAGLPDGWQSSTEWADVSDALESWCALQILSRIGETFGAGVSSKNVSSAVGNQGFNYTRFTDLKKELQDNVDRFKETFIAHQTPFMLDFV